MITHQIILNPIQIYCFQIGDYAVAEVLLNHTADPEMKNSNGDPLLRVASVKDGNQLKVADGINLFGI